MIAGMTLNIFNNHAKRVKMANLAQTVNVLQAVVLTEGKKMVLTPTYHAMEMYKVHQDAQLIPIALSAEEYAFGGESLPAISASASRDARGRVHLSVVNIDPKAAKKVSVDLGTIRPTAVKGRILTAKNLRDHNSFENPNVIAPAEYNGAKINGNRMELEIPPHSLVSIEI